MDKKSISIEDLGSILDREKFDWRSSFPVSPLCRMILVECLSRVRVGRKHFGVSPGTLANIKKPEYARPVSLRTLTLIFLKISVRPHLLVPYGLSPEVAKEIQDRVDIAVKRFVLDEYDPESELAQMTGSDDVLWKELVGRAKSQLPKALRSGMSGRSPQLQVCDTKSAVLNLISLGLLRHGAPFTVARVTKILKERAEFSILSQRHFENALDCLVEQRHLERNGNTFVVRPLEPSEWRRTAEFRKEIESRNLLYLLEDINEFDGLAVHLSEWLELMETAIHSEDVEGFFTADIGFHLQLAAHSDAAHGALTGLLPVIRRAAPYLCSQQAMRGLHEDHLKICDYILKLADLNTPLLNESESRDKHQRRLCKAMCDHIDNACNLMESCYERM